MKQDSNADHMSKFDSYQNNGSSLHTADVSASVTSGEKSHKLPSWLRDELEKMKQKKLESSSKEKLNAKQVFSNEDDDEEEEEKADDDDDETMSGGEEALTSRRTNSSRHRNHSGPNNEPPLKKDHIKTPPAVKLAKAAAAQVLAAPKPNPLDAILKKIELNEAEKQEIIVSCI